MSGSSREPLTSPWGPLDLRQAGAVCCPPVLHGRVPTRWGMEKLPTSQRTLLAWCRTISGNGERWTEGAASVAQGTQPLPAGDPRSALGQAPGLGAATGSWWCPVWGGSRYGQRPC